MITFAVGVAIGAAFSKFWIAVYNFGKSKFTSSTAAEAAVATVVSAVAKVESTDTTK